MISPKHEVRKLAQIIQLIYHNDEYEHHGTVYSDQIAGMDIRTSSYGSNKIDQEIRIFKTICKNIYPMTRGCPSNLANQILNFVRIKICQRAKIREVELKSEMKNKFHVTLGSSKTNRIVLLTPEAHLDFDKEKIICEQMLVNRSDFGSILEASNDVSNELLMILDYLKRNEFHKQATCK
jgi:hypothetical protein